jgi:hypothetical protein
LKIGKNLSNIAPYQFNLRRFCKYLASTPEIGPSIDTHENYCSTNEDYDVSVLIKALNFCGFEVVQLHEPLLDPNIFINDNVNDGNGVIGYIINYGAWHWVALRYNKDAKDTEKYKLVDSMGKREYFTDKKAFNDKINIIEDITNSIFMIEALFKLIVYGGFKRKFFI